MHSHPLSLSGLQSITGPQTPLSLLPAVRKHNPPETDGGAWLDPAQNSTDLYKNITDMKQQKQSESENS